MKDPYQILGVSKTATQDEIKNAYRNLAKKHHPDLNPGNKGAESKFKDIASAYEQIGTTEARTKFDRGETEEQQQNQQTRSHYGERPFYSQTQHGGGRYSQNFGEDFSGEEFYETLFGGSRRARTQGEDFLYQMDVEFKEAVLGAERVITLPHGKKLQVKIPAGIETGAKLRFKGQGGPGPEGLPAGDAFVEIKVKPHPGFHRVGHHLETEIPISFIEGILGAEIEVPTIDGTVKLQIPPGVSTGSRLRIKGKGVLTGKDRGDQIAILKVVLPKVPSDSLKDAIKNWNGNLSYNPREGT